MSQKTVKRIETTRNKSKKQKRSQPRMRRGSSTAAPAGRMGFGPMVSAPVSQSRSSRGTRPQVAGIKDGIRVSHTELLFDLDGPASAAFLAASYPINPGVGTLFPWLSVIANRFNEYRFTRLEFSYQGRCSSSSYGSVILAVNPDASDPPPTDESEVENYRFNLEDVPWKCIDLKVLCSDLSNTLSRHYVRSGPVANTDIKTYDVGNFLVCTAGVQNQPLGKVYISYDVDLLSPILSDPLGGAFELLVAGTSAAPFGASPLIYGSTPGVLNGNTFTFTQPFKGLVVYGATAVGNQPTLVAGPAPLDPLMTLIYQAWLGDGAASGVAGGIVIYAVSATVGDEIVFTIDNGATKNFASFTQGPYSALATMPIVTQP